MKLRPFLALAVSATLLAACDDALAGKAKPVAATPTPAAPVVTPDKGTAGSTAELPVGLDITWHGQSCFTMRTPGGTTVLMDPVAYEIGYKPPTVKADLVTISHEHPDHNNLKMVEVAGSAAGGATVLRGLTDKGDWAAPIDQSVGDVHVTAVNTFHDDQKGKKFGKNSAFVFDVTLARGGKRRLVHLGNLGQQLDEKQLAALKPVDVLLVPVGGHYTIDGPGADKVVTALAPRFVIVPMHYKTPSLTVKELGPVDPFLAGKTDRTVKVDANNVEIQFGPFNFKAPGKVEGPDQLQTPMIVVLKPRELMSYLWFKAFHIVGVVVWFAGLFYLVRLFVYHAEAAAKPEPARTILHEQFTIMERRLYRGICTPGAVLTVAMGTAMVVSNATLLELPWLRFKLGLVAVLVAYHVMCGVWAHNLAGTSRIPARHFRMLNELPTVLLVAIVLLAVFKTAISRSALWAIAGLVAALFAGIQVYGRLRRDPAPVAPRQG